MRRKKLCSRKGSALHWLAALCLLVATCHILGLYRLTPERALRSVEQTLLTGETAYLSREENPVSGGELRLSRGAETVILSEYGFSWKRGWYVKSAMAAERERPFTAAIYSWVSYRNPQTNTQMEYPYVFGCLEDPAVTELEITCRAEEGGHSQTARLTSKDWIVDENGDRFFFLTLALEKEPLDYSCFAVGYLADGTAMGIPQELSIGNWIQEDL